MAGARLDSRAAAGHGVETMTLRIIDIPCLSDNYAYLVTRDDSAEAVLIDPSEAPPVQAALTDHGLDLVAILATHHHHDHVGGIEALCSGRGALPVYAHASDLEQGRVPRQTRGLADGERFELGGLSFEAIYIPGHTLGAVAYVVEDAVFTGDTLFVAGCGRLFEGTPEMMYRSLNEKLATLPDDTRVYCGHEYTESNLRFASTVEPDSEAIRSRILWARALRQAGRPTVPSTMGDERATNPFLRVHVPAVASRHGGGSPAEVLGAVRQAKDDFR